MTPTRRAFATCLCAFSLLLLTRANAADANWPERPVKFVVSSAAGSSPDIIARLIGQELSRMWGHAVVIDNRPGAGGNIGAQAVARSTPDGYTLWFAHAAPVVLNQLLFKDTGFQAEKDFAPIVRVGVGPMVIAVNPSVPAKNLKELIALARDGRAPMSYATPGSKNFPHLTGASLNDLAGMGMVHIPYTGSQQAITDTIAGRTEIYIDAVAPMAPFFEGDARLRPLAVTSTTRLPGFDRIPTAIESGVNLVVQGWFAYMAPVGVKDSIVQRVTRDVNTVLQRPEIVARLAVLGIFKPGGTTAELATFIRQERNQWEGLAAKVGIERE